MLNIKLINPNPSYQSQSLYQNGTIDSHQVVGIHTTEEIGKLSGFSFELPTNTIISVVYENGHETFNVDASTLVHPGKTLVEVADSTITQGPNIIYKGRITKCESTYDNNGTKKITCQDIQGFLKDSFVFYPAYYDDDSSAGYVRALEGMTLASTLGALKTLHNSFFYSTLNLPNCAYIASITYRDGIESEVFEEDISLDGASIFDAINDCVESVGGEIRLLPSSYYMDAIYLEVGYLLGDESQMQIKTGLNLKSVAKTEDMQDQYTAIMPFGGYSFNEHRLTLSEAEPPCPLNYGGTIDEYLNPNTGSRRKLYAENLTLSAIYGLHIKPVVYDEVVANYEEELKDARDLLVELCKADCEDLIYDVISFSISAYDLYKAGVTSEPLVVHNYYTIIDSITNTNVVARLTGKDTSWDNPAEGSFTFEVDIGDQDMVVE